MDPELIKLINQLDAHTRRQVLSYNGSLQEALKKYTRGNDINDSPSLFEQVAKIAAIFGVALAGGIIAYNAKAAKRAIVSDNDLLKRIFIYHGANRTATRFLDQQADRVEQLVRDTSINNKYPGSALTTGLRIKNIQQGSARVVKNIINLGIKDGKSSWQIAKEIEAYVIPNAKGLRVAPWTITRRELGRPISYIPRGVPAGSVEYNAMRIARTEMASYYQQAPYLAHKDKWYYNGTLWVLSRSHPKIDRCDDYAAHDEGIGIGVWRKPPKIPHPHCLCHTQTKTVNTDEMIDMLKRLNWS